VRPFPDGQAGKWQVSTLGGINPKWSRSGRELFFIGAGQMTAADVRVQGGAFEVTGLRPLFDVGERGLYAQTNYTGWDVDADDQHFLMVQFGGDRPDTRANEFVLVQNWIEELKARLRR
jgi:hypothetical protein